MGQLDEILERAKALDERGLLIGELKHKLSERYRLAWEETTTKELDAAVRDLWRMRQVRRGVHPVGDFDKAGRWHPNPGEERCSCCCKISKPSRVWPYSLIKHCRTRPHIIRLAEEHPEAFERLTGYVRRDYVPLTEILMKSELEELGLALE
jgi:hypothetical protein